MSGSRFVPLTQFEEVQPGSATCVNEYSSAPLPDYEYEGAESKIDTLSPKRSHRSRPSGWKEKIAAALTLEVIKDAAREAWSDLRGTNCESLAVWVLFPPLITLLIMTIIGIANLASYDSQSLSNDSACLPNDTFTVGEGGYNQWAPAGFFEISLPVRTSANFSHVKLIDVSWDIVSPLANYIIQVSLLMAAQRLSDEEDRLC